MTTQKTGNLDTKDLISVFQTSKKVVQDYVSEIVRHNRYKSCKNNLAAGSILDDRSKLIDLYEACLQDAHLKSVIETLESQILGERYMLCRVDAKGRYVRDIDSTAKIQGTQFAKIIRGIVEAKHYGYTLLQIDPEVDEMTGRLKRVSSIERRNICPDQGIVLQRQGFFNPHYVVGSFPYKRNCVLINSGDLGMFSATTPIILAKRYTFGNFVNFAATYGMPIIHGKSADEGLSSKQQLADSISSAAQNRVLVTGLEDSIDIKSMTLSNSERIYAGVIEMVNAEVSNLIVGSQSMAGAQQSYVGSTNAHQDVFRDRIEVYREYIENIMDEEIIPRLVDMGFIPEGLRFKYANKLEMNNSDKIKLFDVLAKHYEVDPSEIEQEFGVVVKGIKKSPTSNFISGK